MGKKTGKASPSKSACAVALDSQNEFLFTLVEAAKRMGNITDPAEMFRTLAEIVRDALKINAPSVFTFDRESSVLRLVCAAGCDFQTGALKLNTEDIPRKLAEGQTMRVDEKNQQAARFAELLDVGLQGRFSFEMLTPVIYENHLIALLALALAAGGCAQSDDCAKADDSEQIPERLSVSIELPADGSTATIGDRLVVRISARGPNEVTSVQWHSVALLNLVPMQIQYGRQDFLSQSDVSFEDELNVPFNSNFTSIDIYAMAEDAAGNRAAAISRVQVQDYQP